MDEIAQFTCSFGKICYILASLLKMEEIMSKIITILSATLMAAGAIGGSSLTVTAPVSAAEPTGLQENTDDGIFRVMRLDPYAGMMRLKLVIPEGKTLKRVVTARPDEDRYRLMLELDAAALKVLDGGAEGLILSEFANPELMMLGQVFDNWVGFSVYDYLETGLRFLELNPADVMYVGILLQDTETGEEIRYYHKVNYRSCAHEQVIISGDIIMCEVEHGEGKSIYVPEATELTGEAPTWEEELVILAKDTVKEYFDELKALEKAKDEGGKIEVGQIEALKVKGEGMDFAKFPELSEIKAIKADFLMRVEALNSTETGTGQGTGQGTGMGQGSGHGSNQLPSSGLGVSGNSGVQSATKPQSVVEIQSASRVQSTSGSSTESEGENDARVEQVSEFGMGLSGEWVEDQEELAVPKLGGSWAERYGIALLIAGASLIGVTGWFLIGMLIKKRKRDER